MTTYRDPDITTLPPADLALSDIETTAIEYDGSLMLIPEVVHMIAIENHDNGDIYTFGPDPKHIEQGVRYLERCKRVVFHNGLGFDFLVLRERYNFDMDAVECLDSIVLLRLFHSNIKEKMDYALAEKQAKRPPQDKRFFFNKGLIGKHGLEAWGLRLKKPCPKDDYAERMKALGKDPWAEFNELMYTYGIQDVVVLSNIWNEFIEPYMTPSNRLPILIEHFLQEMMVTAERSGIVADREQMEKLATELATASLELEEKIKAEFPPRLEPVKWVYTELPQGKQLQGEAKKEVDALVKEADAIRKELARLDNDDEDEDSSEEARELAEDMLRLHSRIAEVWRESGVDHVLPPLARMHPSCKVYRPYYDLPPNYQREMWGEEFTPKVNRKVTDRTTKEVLYEAVKDCPYVKVRWVELNPRSRDQVKRRLLELGWQPTEFTDKGNPKTSEVELTKLSEELPVAKSLATYLMIQKRLGALRTGKKAWEKMVASSTGRIHPTTTACATVTFRGAHSNPNISQVPSVRVKELEDKTKVPLKGVEGKWGWDCRACFTVPRKDIVLPDYDNTVFQDWSMVGSDLEGIEMRVWAHFLWPFDGGYFADIVLNKDVHEENRKILGFTQRRDAKSWLYACVPMDTLALTRRGWKRYDELIIGEDIMTYNAETKEKEWQPLLELVKYDDAPIMHLHTSNGFSVRCTPNHRWFVKHRTQKRGERYYEDRVVTAEELNSEDLIIRNAPLSESARRGSDITLIHEKYEHDWISDIMSASSRSRQAFLQGFLLADGYLGQYGFWRWSQNKGNIAEALILASYLEHDKGLYIQDRTDSKNPMYVVGLSTKGHVTGQRLKKENIGNGEVWCPRTTNGSWVMRQGNCITITGNTMYGGGDWKLGFIIDPLASPERQKKLGLESRMRFMRGMKGYKELDTQIQRGVSRGYLLGLDGRKIPVRKKHAGLNTLLQGNAAIISKFWIRYSLDELETNHGLRFGYDKDFTLLLYSHDETQWACRPGLEEVIKESCRMGARRTQEVLKFRLPIGTDEKVGAHWGDTH